MHFFFNVVVVAIIEPRVIQSLVREGSYAMLEFSVVHGMLSEPVSLRILTMSSDAQGMDNLLYVLLYIYCWTDNSLGYQLCQYQRCNAYSSMNS